MDNETYRKNEDSEGNSYTLIQGQVAGKKTSQFICNYNKEQTKLIKLAHRPMNMLAAFPLPKAKHWWSHCRSLLESPAISTSFFAWPLKKGAIDLS